jgi:AcrR family transcriptional regulator
MVAPAAPRWQRRPEDRPAEILDAALEVFADQGFARARLDDIAKRAGVSKGTLYLYYASKDALFISLVRARITPALDQAEARLAAHAGPWEPFLVEMLTAIWRTMSSERLCLIGKLVMSEHTQFPEVGRIYFEEVVLRARRLLQTVVDHGIASGEFRPEIRDIAPRAIPAMLAQLANSRLFFVHYEPEAVPSDEALISGALALALRGVARAGA